MGKLILTYFLGFITVPIILMIVGYVDQRLFEKQRKEREKDLVYG